LELHDKIGLVTECHTMNATLAPLNLGRAASGVPSNELDREQRSQAEHQYFAKTASHAGDRELTCASDLVGDEA
jgi:hypothetical protein